MQLRGYKIELALLDDLININQNAYELQLIGSNIGKSREMLQNSIKVANQGLAKAKTGLESAKQLGDQKTIETFTRWMKRFEDRIKINTGNLKVLDQLDII